MKFTSATVYELLAISEAFSALIAFVDSPGEPGCKIGVSLSAFNKLPKSERIKVNETAIDTCNQLSLAYLLLTIFFSLF